MSHESVRLRTIGKDRHNTPKKGKKNAQNSQNESREVMTIKTHLETQ